MYCVVMAGGSGTRFWPKSREDRSKQFLNIFGKESLIQSTLKRFEKIVGCDNIYIVAKSVQKALIKEHATRVPEKNLIFEPMGKNTAPCIGLVALHIDLHDPDAVMVVTPADHLVKKEGEFRKAVKAAEQLALEKDAMVTIGIPPTRPSTGYGYIQINGEEQVLHHTHTYKIKTFAEKPNIETARRFVESGDFFWNSGIFIFKVSVLLATIEEYLPELHECLMEIKKSLSEGQYDDVLNRVYHQIKSVSLDYGVMEMAQNIYMVKGNFIWNDLGSWNQVYALSPQDTMGNVSIGNTILIETNNSYVASDHGIVAVLGLDDVVVVRDGDAVLVCKRDRTENVRMVVDRIRRKKLAMYL